MLLKVERFIKKIAVPYFKYIQSNTPFFFNQSSNHPILLWSGVALFLALLNILIAKFLYKCAKKILHKKG